MELEELAINMESLLSDDIEFFAHLTTKDKGNLINELGIIIDDNRLFSAVNPITDEFYINPHKYILTSLGNPQTRGKEIMVIVARQINEEIIRKYGNSYIIPSENILGYLDLSSEYFISNENSLYETNTYTIL